MPTCCCLLLTVASDLNKTRQGQGEGITEARLLYSSARLRDAKINCIADRGLIF